MFKNWFGENLVKDKDATARWWLQNLPTKPIAIIEAGVHEIVNNMSNDALNDIQLWHAVMGREVHEDRYDEPIAGNLLETDSKEVKRARGTITTMQPGRIAFRMEPPDQGWLFIQHQPVMYDEEDRTMLDFVVRHELNHVHNWLDATVRGTTLPPTTDAMQEGIWDNDRYANNLYEARAYADQLSQMMGRFNNDIDLVVQLLQRRTFALDHDIMRVAIAFLQNFKKRNESVARILAPAAMAAASLFTPQASPPPLMPPRGMERRQVDEAAVQRAAMLAVKIVESLRFRNFIRMPK